MDTGVFHIPAPKNALFFLKVHQSFSLAVRWKATNTVVKNLVNLCPRPVRIYSEGKEMPQHLSSYLEVGRWVPECLAVQYQGGLRALRKLKQLPGETFPWVWRLIPLQQLLG